MDSLSELKKQEEYSSDMSLRKTGSLRGGRENLFFAIHYAFSHSTAFQGYRVSVVQGESSVLISDWQGWLALYHLLLLPGKSCHEVNTVLQVYI